MAKIEFDNKVDLTVKPIAEINKVTASNINEIKTVVNGLDDDKANSNEIFNEWSSGTYTTRAKVIQDNQLWQLSDSVVLPFNSVDFQLEVTENKWGKLGSSFPSVIVTSLSTNSVAPSTTIDIIIRGSFFTLDTFFTIDGGVVVNSNIFLDDNTFKINVTTPSTIASNLDITANNGVPVVLTQKFNVSAGTIYVPDTIGDAQFLLDSSSIGKVTLTPGAFTVIDGSGLKIISIDLTLTGDMEIEWMSSSDNNGESRSFNIGLAETSSSPTTASQMIYWIKASTATSVQAYNLSNNFASANYPDAETRIHRIKRIGSDVFYSAGADQVGILNTQPSTNLTMYFFMYDKTTIHSIKLTQF